MFKPLQFCQQLVPAFLIFGMWFVGSMLCICFLKSDFAKYTCGLCSAEDVSSLSLYSVQGCPWLFPWVTKLSSLRVGHSPWGSNPTHLPHCIRKENIYRLSEIISNSDFAAICKIGLWLMRMKTFLSIMRYFGVFLCLPKSPRWIHISLWDLLWKQLLVFQAGL